MNAVVLEWWRVCGRLGAFPLQDRSRARDLDDMFGSQDGLNSESERTRAIFTERVQRSLALQCCKPWPKRRLNGDGDSRSILPRSSMHWTSTMCRALPAPSRVASCHDVPLSRQHVSVLSLAAARSCAQQRAHDRPRLVLDTHSCPQCLARTPARTKRWHCSLLLRIHLLNPPPSRLLGPPQAVVIRLQRPPACAAAVVRVVCAVSVAALCSCVDRSPSSPLFSASPTSGPRLSHDIDSSATLIRHFSHQRSTLVSTSPLHPPSSTHARFGMRLSTPVCATRQPSATSGRRRLPCTWSRFYRRCSTNTA